MVDRAWLSTDFREQHLNFVARIRKKRCDMKTPKAIPPPTRTRTFPCLGRLPRPRAVLIALLLFSQPMFAADFSVTTPGGAFAFTINGMQNPTLTLFRGKTYTFDINTTVNFHPFEILGAGVQNNNISTGTLTYTVPNVAANYNYICSIHGFGGQILTVAPPPPPPPPTIRILRLSVGTNVVLFSTGTNTWSVNPLYSTNLSTTNWYALTVVTNTFLNGTNETICGRPPGTNLFFRIRSQPL